MTSAAWNWLNDTIDKKFDGSDIYLISDRPPWVRANDMGVREMTSDYAPTESDIIGLMDGKPNSQALHRALEDVGFADFAIELDRWRMRVNISRQNGRKEVRAVLRLLKDRVPPLDSLGLPHEQLAKYVNRRSGIILITGITGSGKSTTMASMLLERAKRADHLITLEDPIEYPLTRLVRDGDQYQADLQQVEIGTDSASFADALRGSLRQDPDVVLVGEINNGETADLAIKAAETGHLVLATLHTRSAPLTIENLIDKFPIDARESLRKNLAEYLIAVISQMLVPTVDNRRALAYEIMTGDNGISQHIKDGKIDQIPNSIRSGGTKYGMRLLNDTLLKMIRDNQISTDVAMDNTYDRESLSRSRA